MCVAEPMCAEISRQLGSQRRQRRTALSSEAGCLRSRSCRAAETVNGKALSGKVADEPRIVSQGFCSAFLSLLCLQRKESGRLSVF